MLAKTFVGCLAETIAFHGGVILSCFLLQRALDAFKAHLPTKRRERAGGVTSPKEEEVPAIRKEFRFSLIPLALFYSSLTKLFLLFLLTIWRPSNSPSTPTTPANDNSTASWATSNSVQQALSVLDFLEDDKLDREWIVRNVLGGMSAGFGLRVILDSHPLFVTMTILVGWATKTAIAGFIGNWIGGNRIAEIWMAYSIP
ncbi:sterol homeostasis protein [Marasmius tenuissimus]|nr:sterol homeostasis protein [Marasmius tenuissimus]